MLKPLLIGLFLSLVAFESFAATAATAAATPAAKDAAKASAVQTLEWTDLLPPEDLAKMEALPEVNHEGGEGPSNGLKQQMTNDPSNQDPSSQAWSEVLQSANVRGELNGKKVKIPGFIVPIEYDEAQNISAFFLVPYFGACIHVPPPPPNQIIFVTNAKGLKADMIYNPFWIEGTLTTDTMSHDLANSAYSLKADSISEYVYE
ncbi:hypothetical protein A5320_01160 [Rheinheimera sp. SA_1]|uniref:DUF3299 domain-containing protein n=1 Tax=Rheinheimera sp. SA_1 TaxID=1827365 RepID=UPI000801FE8C|nr:DUF3299 domain-containing protein [Rheinheimera sp. SA_1]OBP16069.1 hypothetical protein A5320_01160 [Rheinheimera sp. SA_1]